MQGSVERVRAVLRGDLPDRPPLYELFRNDAAIEHFTGSPLTVEDGPETVYRAYEPAVDATRPAVRAPDAEGTLTLPDGRRQRRFRWTAWTEPRRYADTDAYARAKREVLAAFDPCWGGPQQRAMDDGLAAVAKQRRKLGEVFFFPGGPGLGLMGIYGEVGLEAFAYYLNDLPDLIDELLECNALRALAWIGHLPEDCGIEAVFCGDDIAFKTGPLLAPAWFARHYTPRLARVIGAYHARGIKVLFHSDGNLLPILDQLVDAGIDGLNPLEVLAGMDPPEVHRRFPRLFLAGGIDVSQLLPFGSPEQVAHCVRHAIDGTGGRLMVGSSTELNNEVPLRNYLALRQTVLETRYR